jgi:hypothetical protein
VLLLLVKLSAVVLGPVLEALDSVADMLLVTEAVRVIVVFIVVSAVDSGTDVSAVFVVDEVSIGEFDMVWDLVIDTELWVPIIISTKLANTITINRHAY